MPQESYDLVIIGSGPGGYVAAVRAAQVGLRTAIVEKEPVLGGTCLWRGCIPTKALLENAAVYEQTRRAKEFGITTGDVALDWRAVMQRKSRVVSRLGRGVEALIARHQIAAHRGHGRLAGRGKVSVTAPDGAETMLSAKNVLIATGSAPRGLPGLTVDGKRIVTSDEILELQRVPASLMVLGAGAVGVEFASIFHRFGAKVTLVEMLARVVPLEDEEISEELGRILSRQGMTVHTGVKAGNVRVAADGVRADLVPAADGVAGGQTVASNPGKPRSVTSDLLLLAVGRKPATERLGLEGTGVQVEKGYIRVDGCMRTGEPGVYAIGDVVATPPLAHVASAEGILAVEHMAGREVRPINYDHVPSATYCEPEVASIGLTEARARQQGHDVRVGKFPFSHSSKAPILGATDGFVKMVAEARYGELLGVHVIGPRATEMIAEAGVALSTEATVEEMFRTMHPHPTLSEAMAEAAHGVFGRAIHA